MDTFLEQLNDDQRKAVLATEGKVKVVAGAGSGKTRAIAYRYAHLVNNLGIDPGNILCLTFTNKAAQEMKQRIGRMVPPGCTNDFVCTFHGFCIKVLRRDIHRLGYPKTFTVLDEDDGDMLARQVLEALGMDRTRKTVRKLLADVSHFKTDVCPEYVKRYILPDAPRYKDTSNFNEVDAYIHYQALNYLVDFDDLIAFALYLLYTFKDVREYWQEKLNYVMVDEGQDCAAEDWRLINVLTGRYHNIFIVGDPDQAIYEWRGAMPAFFVDWQADRQIVMARNYRSTPDILQVANSVIANNHNRIPKDLYTQLPAGEVALHFHGKTEKEEAKWIVRQIARLTGKRGKLSPADCAVLMRSSFSSRAIEHELIGKRIPYVVWGGVRFYERREIKDALSYLRLVANPDDEMAFARIVNVPSRRFGATSLKKVQAYARAERTGSFEALRRHLDEWAATKAAEPLRLFIDMVDEARRIKDAVSVGELLNLVLRRSGLTDWYRNDTEEERLENLEELIASVRRYDTYNDDDDDASLEGYLQNIALYTNADSRIGGECVKLMTIHQSKGLEFPVVFVVGLSEGIFPNYRSMREGKLRALEEERRLMYVAVTRARQRLYLTESEGYNVTTRVDKYPSRFLAEITPSYLKHEGKMDPAIWQDSARLRAQTDFQLLGIAPGVGPAPGGAMGSPAAGPAGGTPGIPGTPPQPPFPVGTRVNHRFLGQGTVIAFSEDMQTARVRFGATADTDRFIRIPLLTPVKP